ncbi:hypothetical protein A4A49_31656 [Nicotiana attenuata]|uniref:Uncharacterized protein n=1 Tax=Nicotiana attenuata TaxID=49451 RepID=A0A1J6ICS8_NICAT|nr:hypothetical protein A4A49_31656 [Nicotiana attenuata]
MAEDRCAWPRRSSETRISRTRSQKTSNILDANYGEKVTRMKFVVKKEDLNKVLEALADGNIINKEKGDRQLLPSVSSLEQRLNFMRKRQQSRRANQLNSSWRPVLQGIPEERY